MKGGGLFVGEELCVFVCVCVCVCVCTFGSDVGRGSPPPPPPTTWSLYVLHQLLFPSLALQLPYLSLTLNNKKMMNVDEREIVLKMNVNLLPTTITLRVSRRRKKRDVNEPAYDWASPSSPNARCFFSAALVFFSNSPKNVFSSDYYFLSSLFQALFHAPRVTLVSILVRLLLNKIPFCVSLAFFFSSLCFICLSISVC